MKIIHYSEAEAKQYANDTVQGVTGRVVIGKADGANNFCMRVFEVAPGGHTCRHTHEWDHEAIVHSGEGAVLRDGQWVSLTTGSVIYIPSNEEHQLKNTGDTPFVFVCLVPAGAPEI